MLDKVMLEEVMFRIMKQGSAKHYIHAVVRQQSSTLIKVEAMPALQYQCTFQFCMHFQTTTLSRNQTSSMQVQRLAEI